MLTKIGGLARSLYILLAIFAGFVPMGGMNVALVLVVLGLISGLSMPRERLVLALAAVIALPLIGTALTVIPAIGEKLGAVMANLQLGVAGAAATAMALLLYELTMEGVTGLAGGGTASRGRATA
jgi:hypothetical protein